MLVDHGIEARPPDENQKNAVKAADLPSILLERIEAAFPEPAIFGLLETESWPDGALRSLIDCRLLQETSRATSILCDGCEWSCCKPVIVRTGLTNRSARAFVECDEEPDLGRIFIPLERLKRYRLTLAMLASFIRQALAISSTSFIERSKSISLGRIKGRYRAAYRRFELMISHTPSAVA